MLCIHIFIKSGNEKVSMEKEDNLPLERVLLALRKPQECKKLFQHLSMLRKYVNSGNHRQAIDTIRKSNMLKPLIICTQFDKNIRVIDVTLSILGNCCMNASVVRQLVLDLNILPILSKILEKHSKDSIYGRVFRILGNLCDAIEAKHIIDKESKVVKFTIEFLRQYVAVGCNEDVVFTVPTVSMALRFVKKMLSPRTFVILAKEYDLHPVIGMVLIKSTKQWMLNKNDDALINDLLKIFLIITSASYKANFVISELKTTESGDSLMCLADVILLQPERITKVILRIAHISKNLSDLPIVNVVHNLLNEVERQSNSSNVSQVHLLSCVSLLMNHYGFHDLMKQADTTTILVKLLGRFSCTEDWSIQCCIYITHSLLKCKYNEELVASQINANIIPLIIDKLATLTGKSTEIVSVQLHDRKDYQRASAKRFKRSADLEAEAEAEKLDMEQSYYCYDRCGSPSSLSDISSCGPYSPAATSNFNGEESDSDNYSPLCSENEVEDDDKEDVEVVEDLAPSDTDDKSPELKHSQIQLRHRLRANLCSLLKCYCIQKSMHPHLGETKIVTIISNLILDAFVNEEMTRVEMSIMRAISSSHTFLMAFMATEFLAQVYEVQRRAQHGLGCCSDCDKIQMKVDAIMSNLIYGYGTDGVRGDLASILLSKDGNLELKQKYALSISYVIRNKYSLIKLLLDYGALNMLMDMAQDDSNTVLQTRGIKSLCTLATQSLRIKNPVEKQNIPRKLARINSSKNVTIGQYVPPQNSAHEVRFRLDDGSIVIADREQISKKADYFAAMFSGAFLESHTDEVKLTDVSNATLQCLLELLNFDLPTTCTISIEHHSLSTIMDVILLTDRILLNDLNYLLCMHLEQRISVEATPTIYTWSIESGTNLMRIESVAFSLVNDAPYPEKLTIFERLFEVGYKTDLLDDTRKLICQFL